MNNIVPTKDGVHFRIYPSSTCAHCGRPMPSGVPQRCPQTRDGWCTHHIPEALRSRLEGLTLALRGLIGRPEAKFADSMIGWRGTWNLSNEKFQCEFCRAEHFDSSLINHTAECPVTTARAMLEFL